MREFEQTEMTKTILMALKSFAADGYYNGADKRKKCEELIAKIEKEKLDVRLSSREE